MIKENKNIQTNNDVNTVEYQIEEIKQKIFIIRGKQVMLDSDVAERYQYTTKNINKAMKRNINRFPEDFCFQLTEDEFQNLRFHFGTLNQKVNNGEVTRKYLPYVYTEQGVAMLSGMLKSEIAVQVSINIMRAFVEMRKFLVNNQLLIERINNIELNQIENKLVIDEKIAEYDRNFQKLFKWFDKADKEEFKQKIFFDGQIWDSYNLIITLIKRAENRILIIDNYIDDSILEMLSKKKKDVEVVILTSNKSNILNLDVQKFNKEYPILKIAKTNKFHDRFIVIDNKELYHCGASLKDLGKKCFGINRIDDNDYIEKLKKNATIKI